MRIQGVLRAPLAALLDYELLAAFNLDGAFSLLELLAALLPLYLITASAATIGWFGISPVLQNPHIKTDLLLRAHRR